MTKASPVARERYTHSAADLHAYQNPDARLPVPATIRDEAMALAQISETLQQGYLDAISEAVFRGLNTDRLVALQQELARISGEFFDSYRPALIDAVRTDYGLGCLGAQLALADAGLWNVPSGGMDVSFTAPDRAAMAAIANDNFGDLAGQTENMTGALVSLLRTEAGEILVRSIAQGKGPIESARLLEAELALRGFTTTAELKKLQAAIAQKVNPLDGTRLQRTAKTPLEAAELLADLGHVGFVDRAGRVWDLRRYCEMAAHTKLMIAKNEGTRNRMRSVGVNHYILTDHSTDCPICAEYEGKVFWTGDGDALGYELGPDVPIHPNCLHTTIPWVLDAGEGA